MKKSLLIYAAILFILSSCATLATRDSSGITPDKAVLIAKHEIAKLGWLYPENEIKVESFDESQARRANKKSPKRNRDDLVDKLKRFKYWKVMLDFMPGVASNEPDAVVYVNRKDGSILSLYIGEIKGR